RRADHALACGGLRAHRARARRSPRDLRGAGGLARDGARAGKRRGRGAGARAHRRLARARGNLSARRRSIRSRGAPRPLGGRGAIAVERRARARVKAALLVLLAACAAPPEKAPPARAPAGIAAPMPEDAALPRSVLTPVRFLALARARLELTPAQRAI